MGSYPVPLIVPQEVPNDETVTLSQWLVEDGAKVAKGQPVASLIFSKLNLEIEAPADGYMFQLSPAPREVRVSSSIALVNNTEDRPAQPQLAEQPKIEGGAEFTKKAEALLHEHGVSRDAFAGMQIVRERDVLAYIEQSRENADAPKVTPLSKAQLLTAKALSLSAATIPHSFVSLNVLESELASKLSDLIDMYDAAITLTDMLVHATARAAREHPKFVSTFKDDGLILHEEVNVGVAMNLPDGSLVVPVVQNADTQSPLEIASFSRGSYKRLLKQQLKPSALMGGTITVTTLTGTGVTQILPIIVPGQSCIVAMADPFAGIYTLTLGFDHRIVNGLDAARFLVSIKGNLLGA